MSTGFHYAAPPIFIDQLIDDVDQVVHLFEKSAPFAPMGGWFVPDSDGEAQSAMWFRQDWAHEDFLLEGSELFFWNERMIQAAKDYYDAEVIVPHTIYVNLMAALAECGPAHTDNPIFRGRSRVNTPMMLLRTMLWSGLFTRWEIKQATSIWWLNDVEGGGLRYWPHGPDKEPAQHSENMANTALLGDNHGMFHQVEPVGPFDKGTVKVKMNAELAPVGDGSGDWAVIDRGNEVYRAPFSSFRASVLWKAHVYSTEEERQRVADDLLSLEQVASIFNQDIAARGGDLQVEVDQLQDSATIGAIGAYYPEAIPVGKGKSIYDDYI